MLLMSFKNIVPTFVLKLRQYGGLNFMILRLRRPGREWRVIARAHAHTRDILFSCAIIARLNFV